MTQHGEYGKPARNRRKKPRRNVLKILMVTLSILIFIFILGATGYFVYLTAALPRVDRLADYKPPIVTQVFSDNGTLVGEFYLERRKVVPVDKMPKKLIQAFVSAEDSSFFHHKGLDYLGIFRAAIKNVLTLSKKEGASTITQQVARSMLLSPEKKFSRKFKEAILAKRMEERLSKDDILYIYLNQIYLGGGSYGVQMAAETYFDKDVDQLNLAEMAMLAGLTKGPELYSPLKRLDRARERQAYVLDRMVKEGYITEAEAQHARRTPVVITSRKKANTLQSAYFLEYIRIQVEKKVGEDLLYKGGLKIYTTMNWEMQTAAHENVASGLKAVDKRQGFRGPVEYLDQGSVEEFCRKVEKEIDTPTLKQGETYQGVVVAMDPAKGDITVRVGDRTGILPRAKTAWAGRLSLVNRYGSDGKDKNRTISLGSVIDVSVVSSDDNRNGAVFSLDQEPLPQAALVALDPRSGAVKAMIGGYDFRRSKFNRATQARRNPGSAFKPIIYAAALDRNMTAATIFNDSPVEYPGSGASTWKPRNYDNTYRGPVTMRTALTNSINVVSVRILEAIGVDYAVEYAKKLGITSPLTPNLTLALGSSSLTPLELTSAYSVFASGGFRLPPYFVSRIEDSDGRVIEQVDPPRIPTFTNITSATSTETGEIVTGPYQYSYGATAVPVVSPETSYIITNLMENVVTSGTGQRAKALGRPVAGKTGTTNNMKDAWFIGYVPQLVTGVWVGYDQERSLGAGGSGGQAAAPIWTGFMQKALAKIPVESFTPPPEIAFVSINPRTGRLAAKGAPGSVRECFLSGTEPRRYDEPAPPEDGEEPPTPSGEQIEQ